MKQRDSSGCDFNFTDTNVHFHFGVFLKKTNYYLLLLKMCNDERF